ncbi:DUF4242 domain-containing protein [Mucilaginibacter xinganensis]|uniref:DUF4242 domain-containing protein n=1 Tax=Mucilaginibacter xinganensis TaxID=1234841 RepID=A0A223NPX6_9SPHI|nr:DUF4242 domain-containing protein [Mucilaginibacter xinganensis]ASU31975.1 hypothetical protein MuYL_0072 [Mucilaginibacter xinganensis]
MKKFVIERNLPGAGKLSAEDLQAISQTSCSVVDSLGKPYQWIESYVTDDKIFCVHMADSEEVIREHANLGGFPVTNVFEVKTMISPATATGA